VYHRRLRVLFDEKKPDVRAAMSEFADLAQRMYEALVTGRKEQVPPLMNANFDLRDRVFHVSDENRRMVMTARNVGASAKFAGSGGAIVGTYDDENMYRNVCRALAEIGCAVLKPKIGQGQWKPVPASASARP
jgi:glucuronokinase